MIRGKVILILVSCAILFSIGALAPISTHAPTQNTIEQVVSSTPEHTKEKVVEKPKIKPKSPTPIVRTPSLTASSPDQKTIAVLSETPPKPAPNFEQINDTARKTVVNILCQTKTSGSVSTITATGVVIDSRGTILTNAHVAQYFLLKNFQVQDFVKCTIRTGSPAYPRYNVELVYISPTWVQNNKSILTSPDPKGTGENDYALLRITDAIDGSPLPSFQHLTIKMSENFDIGETVNLVAYPAGFLGGQSVQQDLSLTSALTTIQDVFTFKNTTIDLISIPGTILSQKGASGGAVVNKDSSLVGIITTSSNAPTTGERDLRAITLPYINRAIQSETGMNLPSFLSQDIATYAQNFQLNTAPSLSKLIQDELLK